MPILLTVFPALLKAPKSLKIDKFIEKSTFRQGGGVGAQAQCFLWGLFFDKSV
jgi:hypothetical protein